MKYIILIIVITSTKLILGQDQGPVNVPRNDFKAITFTQDQNNKNEYVAFIDTIGDYYVPFKSLDSIKELKNVQLNVYLNDRIIFQFIGSFSDGKYVKYYPTGELFGKGKIRDGFHYGYYKEYDKSGELMLKCFYVKNKIRTKGKRFLRKQDDKILCDKKWYKKVNYELCYFFAGTPGFFYLPFSNVYK